MIKLGILTCQDFPRLIAGDQPLVGKFLEMGVEAEPVIWNAKPYDYQRFEALLFRNTWDYFHHVADFFEWLNLLSASGIRTINPLPTIVWNADKSYLQELDAAGVQIIPTVFVEGKHLLQSLDEVTWEYFIIKPAVSGGSHLTQKCHINNKEAIKSQYNAVATGRTWLLQCYEPMIETVGESSLIFFDGVFSHAVRKTPTKGDFRVQVQFGGLYQSYIPDASIIAQASHALKVSGKPYNYARVDGIEIEGTLFIMELELVEPDLYFHLYPEAMDTFVNSVVECLS